MDRVGKMLRIKFPVIREFLAEFLGTYVLVTLGDGSVAQNVYAKDGNTSTFLSVNIAWGLAVTMGVYMSAGISGGHINPAVTMAFSLIGKVAIWKVPIYWLAQYLGAFAGAASVYGVYVDAQNATETVKSLKTAGIYSTFPKDYLRNTTGLGDQILATGLLLMCILAITDKKNSGASKGLAPFVIGFSVTAIGLSFGLNCGYAINPARDLGPRLFTFAAGWGDVVFTARNHWFWVPLAGPHIGAIGGAFLYLLLAGFQAGEDAPTPVKVKHTFQRYQLETIQLQEDKEEKTENGPYTIDTSPKGVDNQAYNIDNDPFPDYEDLTEPYFAYGDQKGNKLETVS